MTVVSFFFFFFVYQPQCALRKSQWRAHKFHFHRALSIAPQLALRTTAAPFQYHQKVSNDTIAFYENFLIIIHVLNIGPITYRYISTARRKTASLTRKQNYGILERLPTWRTFVFILVSSSYFTSAGDNPHGYCATAVYFLHGFFFDILCVASRTAVESAGCSRISNAYDTLSFLACAYRGYGTFSCLRRRRMGDASRHGRFQLIDGSAAERIRRNGYTSSIWMDGRNDVHLIDMAVMSRMRDSIDTRMRKIGMVLHQSLID